MKVGLEHLIDGEIKGAHRLLDGFGSAFDRPREIASGILTLANICDVLIRVIEDQQVEMLRLRRDVDALEEARASFRGRRRQ